MAKTQQPWNKINAASPNINQLQLLIPTIVEKALNEFVSPSDAFDSATNITKPSGGLSASLEAKIEKWAEKLVRASSEISASHGSRDLTLQKSVGAPHILWNLPLTFHGKTFNTSLTELIFFIL